MTHINQRRDLAATWTAENPTLQLGEVGWEEDTRKSKLGDGVTAWNALDYSTAPPDGIAPLASPVFTGNPQAPTPATSDNDTSIATTEFVKDQGYAPLNSPTFVGTAQATTPGTSDDSNRIATTEFVKNQGYSINDFNTLAPVRARTSGNITLSGLQTVDGVALAEGDRVLVAAQTAASENGVRIASASTWLRADDANSVAELQRGTRVAVLEGNIHKFKTFTQTTTLVTLGVTSVTWSVVTYVEAATTAPNGLGTGQMYMDLTSKVLSVWNSAAWVTVNSPLVCTSSTRPSSPKTDQIIFETDTARLMMYVSGTWTPCSLSGKIPYIRVTRNAAASTPAGGTGLLVSWDTLDEQKDGFAASATPGTAITIPKAGLYDLGFHIAVSNALTAGSSLHVAFMVNGAEHQVPIRVATATSLNPSAYSGSAKVRLAAGDTIGLTVYTSIAAGLVAQTTARLCNDLTALWLRD